MIYEGVYTSPRLIFLTSDLVLHDMKKIFCQCSQNYLGKSYGQNFFNFHVSGRWFRWHLKGGVYPSINLKLFFSDILGTVRRLNTVWTRNNAQSSRHFEITQVLRHILHLGPRVYPKRSLVIALVCPCVSVFKYLIDRSFVLSSFLHEVRAP